MAKKMLIDGTYPEEARVVILDNQKVDDWDYKTTAKKQALNAGFCRSRSVSIDKKECAC